MCVYARMYVCVCIYVCVCMCVCVCVCVQPGDLLVHYVELYDCIDDAEAGYKLGDLQYRSFLSGASMHPIWKLHRGDELLWCVYGCMYV